MEKRIYKVEGMHCASCVAAIERVLSRTPGVKSASVNFAAESASIEFDKNAVSESALVSAVKTAGYGLASKQAPVPNQPPSGIQTLSIKVFGMDSPHCAMIVGGALKKLSGVRNSDLDFANQRAKIVYDSSLVTIKEILKVISDAGYKPALEQGDADERIDAEKAEREAQMRTMKRKLLIGGAVSFFVFLGSFPQWFPFIPAFLSERWVLFALATPVQFWVGAQFYSGLKLLVKYRTADMNTLIAIGTLSAYFYSAAVTIFPDFFMQGGLTPEIYFDTSAIIIVLILLGKYFEILMRGRASEAIKKLIGLQPKTAKVVRDSREIEIPIAEVMVGDKVIVRPGERIPVDGKILDGDSEIDESMVTGESMPVHKKTGDMVIGSTINKFGTFTFEARKIGKDTLLSHIIRLVEEAQGSKAPIQRLADRISSYFVPAVFTISALAFGVWFFFGPAPALTFALVNFVAVLIIACPCALGLATPMAIMVSSGSAAQRGILIKDAASLEIANNIDTVILDKTGTLTIGRPELTDIVAWNNSHETEVLTFAASLEQRSEHPLAQAILQYAASQKSASYPLENFTALSGKGLRGFLSMPAGRQEAFLGNRTLMAEIGLDTAPFEEAISTLEHQGKTVMLLAVAGKLLGALAVADVLKKESAEAVSRLKASHIEVWMLTGDNERTARAIATEVGIDHVISEVLPEEKARKVQELQEKGKIVAMVGDGINDAPALAQAHIGIAMGEGTDIAMESANITLMRGDLRLIPDVIRISQRTMSIVKQNLFWAFFYNIALIPVAAGVLYPLFGLLLNPIFAGFAMAASSISVIANSLRLKSVQIPSIDNIRA